MDTDFVERLGDIASKFRSHMQLAKASGIPTASLHGYFTGSEPSRTALVALARAAGVSVHWLATGEGPKVPGTETVPSGYNLIKFFDLRMSGNRLRGIIETPNERARGRLLPGDEIVGRADVGDSVFLIGFSDQLAWEPEISPGDIILIAQQPGHMINQPSDVGAWDFIKDDRIYLIADGDELKLRQLRYRSESVQVIRPDGKVERTLTGAPADFILFGHAAWRSGVLPSARL